MKNKLKFGLALILLGTMAACGGNGGATDTSTKGEATILIEESYKPLFETSIDTFEGQFPKAHITPIYLPEGTIIEKFYAGEAKTICMSRDFTQSEKAELKKKQLEVRSDKIALDAIALIINPQNSDTTITIAKLKRILLGQDTVWPVLKTKINVVFDQENSANFYYLKNLCDLKKLPINVFAVKSNVEVINYVKQNKSALGIIGVNWVSDSDDMNALEYMDGIKVMAVSKDGFSDYYKPYAGFIYSQDYPLSREIWMLNIARKSGLHSGFVNFMIGEKGQLIIQKSALVPAKAPVRLIQLQN